MAKQVPVYRNTTTGRETRLASGDSVTGQPTYFRGTTEDEGNNVRFWYLTGTTDANGRVTVFPTTTGAVGGTALFTAIDSISAIVLNNPTNSQDVKGVYCQSVSGDLKTVIFRVFTGNTIPTISLGVPTTQFAGSGFTVYMTLIGRK